MADYYKVPGPGMVGDVVVGGTYFGPIPYRNIFVESIFAYLPKGAFWTPKRGGFFERFLHGLMDALDVVRLVCSDLAYIRSAQLTKQLDDLELDYGIAKNASLTNSQRRDFLESRINAINNTGSAQEMQAALRLAGFDVYVYSNSPAVDPETLIVGNSALLVNGVIYTERANYLMRAGRTGAYAGKSNARAGRFLSKTVPYEYPLPQNPNAWPFIFFVGGDATFGGSGELINLNYANVSAQQRLQFEEIILKYKPLYTWAALQINYV